MECAVCLERYTLASPHRPIILPHCGHTFCEQCIFQLYATSSPTLPTAFCPSCRVPLPVHRDSLLVNYALISLLSEQPCKSPRDVPRSESSQIKLSPSCSLHSKCPIVLFCVNCQNFICKSCCVNPSHTHLPIPFVKSAGLSLLEPLIQELTTAQLSTGQLIPRLKSYQLKHDELFSLAANQADAVFRARIEQLNRQKIAVTSQLTKFGREWHGFWDGLINATSSHSSYLEEELSVILNESAQEPMTPISFSRKRRRPESPVSPVRPSQDSSAESVPLESVERLLTDPQNASSSEELASDSEASIFTEHLKRLSLTSHPDVTSTRPPSLPAPIVETFQFRLHEVCDALRSYFQNAALSRLSPRRVSIRDKRDAELVLRRLTRAWQAYRNINALRPLYTLFNLPTPRIIDTFSSFLPASTDPPKLTVVFPQIVPGDADLFQNVLRVHCQTLDV